jgi:chromatin structure-remodeling complex subunit RSC9
MKVSVYLHGDYAALPVSSGWYTEATPSNRMVLSIRSGIHSEIAWALDRLYRLCANDQFILKTIPGLTDALFEWPEWYATAGYSMAEKYRLFALPETEDRKRRHALESIFILRNSASNEPNAHELANHPRTLPLLFNALSNLIPDTDMNAEFVLNAIELLQAISAGIILPGPASTLKDPLPTLLQIAGHSSNRSLIIAALSFLAQIFSNIQNTTRLAADSPALAASIRYLPLFVDRTLVDASLNYLYAHLSHPPMAKAFLHHPLMPSTLRVLVSFLLSEQVEEIVNVDISAVTRAIPITSVVTLIHDLTKEELETLIPMPEPQRCYEW